MQLLLLAQGMKEDLTCSKQDNALNVEMFGQIHSKGSNFLHLVLKEPAVLHPLENRLHGNLSRMSATCGVQLLYVHVDRASCTLKQV